MIASLSQLLPGVDAMANVHPLLVHFPIGLYYGFAVAELLALVSRADSLRHAASWMLYFGTLGAAGAVAAGYQAASTVEHSEEVHAILERHADYGLLVLVLGVLLSCARWIRQSRGSSLVRSMEFVLALVLVALMTRGADLGGLMVYGHAVAVNCPDAAAAESAPAAQEQPPTSATESTPGANSAEPHPHRHKHTHPHQHDHKP